MSFINTKRHRRESFHAAAILFRFLQNASRDTSKERAERCKYHAANRRKGTYFLKKFKMKYLLFFDKFLFSLQKTLRHMISEWWIALAPGMKILWSITLAASLVFIIQSILTFIGADAGDNGLDIPDGDFDPSADVSTADAGNPGMNLYTFRNLVNFLLGFGWTAILLRSSIDSTALLLIIAFIVGVMLVAVVMFLFKWLSTMQQSGNINVYKSAVGCQGTVYLTIPAERSGEGKIQITINNSVREYNALTDGDAISTGTPIKVIEVLNPSTLLVEELKSYII